MGRIDIFHACGSPILMSLPESILIFFAILPNAVLQWTDYGGSAKPINLKVLAFIPCKIYTNLVISLHASNKNSSSSVLSSLIRFLEIFCWTTKKWCLSGAWDPAQAICHEGKNPINWSAALKNVSQRKPLMASVHASKQIDVENPQGGRKMWKTMFRGWSGEDQARAPSGTACNPLHTTLCNNDNEILHLPLHAF